MTTFVGRTSSQLDQWRDVARKQRVQEQRRQREVVDVVDLPADLELGAEVRVNLDEDVDAEAGRACDKEPMKANVSGIMKQLVPGRFTA